MNEYMSKKLIKWKEGVVFYKYGILVRYEFKKSGG
jgi:hypothetical protein